VLGKAEVKFIKPTMIGDELTAKAVVLEQVNTVKSLVTVTIKNQNDIEVFNGEFICFSLEKHVLDT
jgi:acyl dehydratase